MAVLLIFSRNSPGYRFPLRIPSLTDNSGTESGGNKLFSTTFPMNLFLEKLTILCTISGMELDLSHIAGDRNDEADALSRWDLTSDPPFGHQLCNRIDIYCKIFGCLFVPLVYILLIRKRSSQRIVHYLVREKWQRINFLEKKIFAEEKPKYEFVL